MSEEQVNKEWQQGFRKLLKQGVATKTLAEGMICQECQQPYKLLTTRIIGGPNLGEPITWRQGCMCGNKQLGREALEEEEQAKKKHIKRQFQEKSLVSENLRKCTFETFEPKNETQEAALKLCKKIASHFKPGTSYNLLMYGAYGIGKSHLCYSMCQELSERGISSIFISMPQLCQLIKDTFDRKDAAELDIYKALFAADFVVIDELGAERKSDWTDEIFLTLLEGRAGKFTVYTSNLDKNDLAKRMTPRNYSKFNLDMHYFKLTGEDFRQKGAKDI